MPYDEYGNPVTYRELVERKVQERCWAWFFVGMALGVCLGIAVAL